MTRAQHVALMAFPADYHIRDRVIFRFGYERAEKDIIGIIESRIGEILGDAQPNPILRIELQELIDKITKDDTETNR